MPSPRPLPQELIDKIVDQLGEDYRDPNQQINDVLLVARKALHACTLVSKNWTSRSRAQLFKEVYCRVDSRRSIRIPPKTLMPYITKLEMQLLYAISWLSPSPHTFTPFYACPIAYLGITQGSLTTARVHLVEFITTISATLQTVVFKTCVLPLRLIHDIVLAHPGLKKLHLRCCDIGDTISDRPTTSHMGIPRSTDLELGVFSALDWQEYICTMAAVAQLPIKFCRLNFNFLQCLDIIPSVNAFIEANAESLSSLTASFISRKSRTLSQKKNAATNLTTKLCCSGVSGGR